MQHLSGHNVIVMLNAVYEDDGCFHLVMELCSDGRLVDQMTKEGRYFEHRSADVLKELMLVIKYCHEMGVVHRDIKPENILLTSSGKMKLADFGLAVRVATGHPFIMFYTEGILKSFSVNSKAGFTSEALPHKLVSTSLHGSDKRQTKSSSLSESSSFVMTTKRPANSDPEKHDDCCLMDALTVAIEQVRISEPKRSRMRLSNNSIQQPYSANSLCQAF